MNIVPIAVTLVFAEATQGLERQVHDAMALYTRYGRPSTVTEHEERLRNVMNAYSAAMEGIDVSDRRIKDLITAAASDVLNEKFDTVRDNIIADATEKLAKLIEPKLALARALDVENASPEEIKATLAEVKGVSVEEFLKTVKPLSEFFWWLYEPTDVPIYTEYMAEKTRLDKAYTEKVFNNHWSTLQPVVTAAINSFEL
jgi:hypothetical protein